MNIEKTLTTSIEGHIVDVLHRRIFDGTLHIQDHKISRIEEHTQAAAAPLPYILPGFVDAHIHIESTLLTPSHFAPLAVAKGVLAVVADPHEIANVMGVPGVDFMIADGQRVRFHFHFCAPSCVPSTGFETAGATIDSHTVKQLLQREDICGLAEMMNYPGVLSGDPETMAKLHAALEAGKPIDGHAPGLRGAKAKQYIDAGITSDHECTSMQEAEEKMRLGMTIAIREGSAARDFEQLYGLLASHDNNVMLCSDDKYPDELQQGYIDDMVRRAIAKGMPFWNVLQAACVTPVQHYNLHQGLLQPGDVADLICVDNFMQLNVLKAFIDGTEVFRQEHSVLPALRYGTKEDIAATPCNNFHALPLTASMLRVEPHSDSMKVIVASEGQLLTRIETAKPHIEEGKHNVVSDIQHDVLKLVVYNRYTPAPPAIAFVKGFGLQRGALGSTIAHDSHNLIAVGCSDAEIMRVLNKLIAMQGGIAVCNGTTVTELSLPVAGLMSARPGTQVAAQHLRLKQAAHSLGCPFSAPFMTLAFMALPVIPELKLTDKGLFDSRAFCFTPLFE